MSEYTLNPAPSHRVGVGGRNPGTWSQVTRVAGPGLLVAVGYMDPGNWATDIEAGSRYGYDLLCVVLATGIAAMLLQWHAMRLGLVTGHDLARMARERCSVRTRYALWLLAELAIIATDIAEVLGSALAFNLLLGVPLWAGVLLTGLDALLLLALGGCGFRRAEAIATALVLTITLCFAVQLFWAEPSLPGMLHGIVPNGDAFQHAHGFYLAVGILGATVMPHNLYLHSAVARLDTTGISQGAIRRALRLATIDIVAALSLATLVNCAILALAAATFHEHGYAEVTRIDVAYRLLDPITGTGAAALLFGLALLASGQSATFTGTIAGQVILEGFLDLRIPPWQRRLITRGLALIPAFIGVQWFGHDGVGRLLVMTQVVLSLQLPFAIFPLLRFTGNSEIMGPFVSGAATKTGAWLVLMVIVAANGWLIVDWLGLT